MENRYNILEVNKTNSNDVIKLLGQPHTKSIKNESDWFYFERTITRGEFQKLGRNILKENNVLALRFDKFGIFLNNTKPKETISFRYRMDYLGFFSYNQNFNSVFTDMGEIGYGK